MDVCKVEDFNTLLFFFNNLITNIYIGYHIIKKNMNSLASKFGEDPNLLTNADILAPIRPMRSLLTGSKFGRVNPFLNPEPPFINEDEAIAEDKMAGITSELPAGMSGEGIVDTGLKLAGHAAKALKIGKAVGKLATGEVGTTISNVLSEKFNQNPEWRPGFVGEAHLVLPTKHGLTRANFCGPGTNLLRRLERGDRGVSQVDTACSKHDMAYHLAKSKKDIRDADNALIRDVDAVTDISGAAGFVQRNILKAGLKAKTLGEDVGVFGSETFTSLPGLEGRGLRGHHAQMACSLANRLGHKTGPFARICDMQGTGIVSNPQEATDLSHSKAHDPSIANLQSNFPGRGGIIEDVIGKPADKLRKAVFKDMKRTRRLRDSAKRKAELLRGSGLHLPGQSGGQFSILASLAASFIIPKIIEAIIKKQKGGGMKGKGAVGDFFKGFVKGLTDPVGSITDVVKSIRSSKSGKGPRDPTIGNLIGRGLHTPGAGLHAAGGGVRGRGILQDIAALAGKRNPSSKRKNPGHALGEKILKMHGLTPAKLHRMGISEKHLLPIIKKAMSSTSGSGLDSSGAGLRLPGQSGGQFGILASLAASFIIPKIIEAITKKK